MVTGFFKFNFVPNPMQTAGYIVSAVVLWVISAHTQQHLELELSLIISHIQSKLSFLFDLIYYSLLPAINSLYSLSQNIQHSLLIATPDVLSYNSHYHIILLSRIGGVGYCNTSRGFQVVKGCGNNCF